MFKLRLNVKYTVKDFVCNSIRDLVESYLKTCIANSTLRLDNRTEIAYESTWYLVRNDLYGKDF
jgi:hypothetical protein